MTSRRTRDLAVAGAAVVAGGATAASAAGAASAPASTSPVQQGGSASAATTAQTRADEIGEATSTGTVAAAPEGAGSTEDAGDGTIAGVVVDAGGPRVPAQEAREGPEGDRDPHGPTRGAAGSPLVAPTRAGGRSQHSGASQDRPSTVRPARRGPPAGPPEEEHHAPARHHRHHRPGLPVIAATAAADTTGGLTGITGFFADLIASLGEVGVGLLTFVETVIPPVPSEVVLPLAGFLSQQGRLSLIGVLVASTAGSVVGALTFYALGALLGLDRSIALLSRVPLVDRGDLQRASAWFHRHGTASVLLGRVVPGVRSLVSLPAGAQRMPLATFILLTAVGSGVWNTLLVGAGYAFATQWDLVGRWASTASNVVVVGLLVLAVLALVRRARRRRPTGRPAWAGWRPSSSGSSRG